MGVHSSYITNALHCISNGTNMKYHEIQGNMRKNQSTLAISTQPTYQDQNQVIFSDLTAQPLMFYLSFTLNSKFIRLFFLNGDNSIFYQCNGCLKIHDLLIRPELKLTPWCCTVLLRRTVCSGNCNLQSTVVNYCVEMFVIGGQ